MSCAARAAAGSMHARLMRGEHLGERLMRELYLSQAELDRIALGIPPATAEVLARSEYLELRGES